MDTAAARSLTVTWDDPMIYADASKHMSGLELLRAMLAGELPPPPVSRLIGQRAHTLWSAAGSCSR